MIDEVSRMQRSDIFFVEDAAGRHALTLGGRWALSAFFLGLVLGYFGSRLLF